MKTVWQSVFLVLSFGLVLAWQHTPLSRYTLETMGTLIGLFFILAIFNSNIKKGIKGIHIEIDKPWNVFLINTVVLFLVLATGNFSSPVFFLMYFLSFGVAFAFALPTVIIFMIGILILFLPLALRDDTTRNVLMLSALVALSPFAFFFGRSNK